MNANGAPPRVIFPDGFDERWEYEMPAKGYIEGISIVFGDGSQFRVSFYDPVRLRQDLESGAEWRQPFFAEPGLIVVPEVTVEAIRCAVEALAREGFFDALKPIGTASVPS